jgi:hypothetical protein
VGVSREGITNTVVLGEVIEGMAVILVGRGKEKGRKK